MNKPRLFTVPFLIFLLIPLLLMLAALPLLFRKSMNVCRDHHDLELTSYLDTLNSEKEGGTVIHSFDTTNGAITLQYTIGTRNLYPFAGFQWIVKKENPWIDIRGYDHCTFTINPATTEEVCIIILQFFTEHFSSIDDRMTWRYLSKEVPLVKGQTTYSIPLREFQTPLWWYNQYKKTETEFGPVDFSKLGMISFEEGSDAAGQPKKIVLESFSFEKKQGYYTAQILIAILLLYYIILFTSRWFLYRIRRYRNPVVIPYQKLAIADEKGSEEQKIFEYMGNNFSNPNLSLSTISDAIKIPGNRISFVIKEKFRLSFRQYLNTIRITESKRLLQETQMQISQIGYKVGYSNLTHFCRTFKDVTGISPNSFRLGSIDSENEQDDRVEKAGALKASSNSED